MIRGFRFQKIETTEIEISAPGIYELVGQGVVERVSKVPDGKYTADLSMVDDKHILR